MLYNSLQISTCDSDKKIKSGLWNEYSKKKHSTFIAHANGKSGYEIHNKPEQGDPPSLKAALRITA